MTHGQRQHIPLWQRGLRDVRYELHSDVKNYKDTYPNVENMVSVVKAQASVNLSLVCSKHLASEFRPNRFAASTHRIGSTTILFYSTGKVLVAGSKCIEQSMFLAHMYSIIIGMIRQRTYVYDRRTKRIKKRRWLRLSRRLRFGNMKIENIVGMLRFDRQHIDLEHIYRTNPYEASYSQTFPSVRAKMPGFMALIFDSGYVLFLGLKDMESLYNAYAAVNHMIQRAYATVGQYDAIKYVLWRRQLAIDNGENTESWKRAYTGPAQPPVIAPKVGNESTKTYRNEFRIQQYHCRTTYRNAPITCNNAVDVVTGKALPPVQRYVQSLYDAGQHNGDPIPMLQQVRSECPIVFERLTTADFKDGLVTNLCLAADLSNPRQVEKVTQRYESNITRYRIL